MHCINVIMKWFVVMFLSDLEASLNYSSFHPELFIQLDICLTSVKNVFQNTKA
jgi:hypothetical protein